MENVYLFPGCLFSVCIRITERSQSPGLCTELSGETKRSDSDTRHLVLFPPIATLQT